MALQPPHQFQHPQTRAQNVHPVVQNALHLKDATLGMGVLQHTLVAVIAGKLARVQQLPLLTAKGQIVDLLLHFGVAQPVY